jgi:hypothetical protein
VSAEADGVVAASSPAPLDVHHPEVAVKIELDHEHYAALIVEVQNPAATVAAINAAVAALPSSVPSH